MFRTCQRKFAAFLESDGKTEKIDNPPYSTDFCSEDLVCKDGYQNRAIGIEDYVRRRKMLKCFEDNGCLWNPGKVVKQVNDILSDLANVLLIFVLQIDNKCEHLENSERS